MGKVLQPQNALHSRSPAGASGAEPGTAEALGWQLRAALPPLRLHSVSVYDSQGNVLWLSEGALGPDEHSLVVDALETLGAANGKACSENRLEDGRIASFLAVRAPQGQLVGLVMILADLKSGGEGLTDRLMTAQTRTIVQKLAVLLRPAGPRKPDADPTALVLSLADVPAAPAEPPAAAAPSAPSARGPNAAPARKGSPATGVPDEELTPRAVNDILEFELTDSPVLARPQQSPAATTSSPRQSASTTGSSPALAQPAPASTGNSRVLARPAGESGISPALNHASGAASGSTPALNRGSVSDSGTSAALNQPSRADSGASGAANRPASPNGTSSPAHTTATAQAGKPASAADTGSYRGNAHPASTGPSRALSLDPALVTLEMLPFVKLRSGGRTRRLEILPTGTARELRDPAVLDSLAAQRLMAWLGAHRAAWTLEPTSFTLNLSIATLEDDRFLKQVAAGLQSNGIAPDTVGFEIAEPLCTQRRAQVERFVTACDQLGCFVVIDDFSLDSAVVPLLRSKALRLVKIDSRLTAGALRDKLSQAMVVAIVQAVKVLGIHCAAQQVDSQASLQWLTAVGCDLAQGPMLARQQQLETLLGAG